MALTFPHPALLDIADLTHALVVEVAQTRLRHLR